MRVTRHLPDKHILFDYTLHQQKLEQGQSAKYLRITITDNQDDCKPGLSDHDMVTATCALKPSVQKPRKVPLLSKADWPKFKSLMRDYQQKFLLNHFDRTVEELWLDFVSAIDDAASMCIPTKTIQNKLSLPWITQSIRRLIRRRDDLYRKFKKKKLETLHLETNSCPYVKA